jgi:predicted membrane protein
MENNTNEKRRQEGRIFGGLILIVIGAALLLRNAGFPLPYWLFSWPIILILIGIYSGVKHKFRNNTWIILIAIGSFFLFDRVMDLSLQPYFWPIAIIAMGVVFIVRPERSRRHNFGGFDKKNFTGNYSESSWQQQQQQPESTDSFTNDSSDYLSINSVFSGVKRNVVSKDFKGGKATCIFGGADIDFSQADIQGRAELSLEVVFGGIKLIIPPHWTVINEIDGMFHGVDDKRKFNTSMAVNPDKTLVLKGSVVFGGVDIKSY